MQEKSRKACTKCGQVYPMTSFGKMSRAADGRDYWCKGCKSDYSRRWRRRKGRERKTHAPECVGEKACTKCGEVKTVLAFNGNKYAPDGLKSWCRDCESRYQAGLKAERRGRSRAMAMGAVDFDIL